MDKKIYFTDKIFLNDKFNYVVIIVISLMLFLEQVICIGI
jgi:hypothetical protein